MLLANLFCFFVKQWPAVAAAVRNEDDENAKSESMTQWPLGEPGIFPMDQYTNCAGGSTCGGKKKTKKHQRDGESGRVERVKLMWLSSPSRSSLENCVLWVLQLHSWFTRWYLYHG